MIKKFFIATYLLSVIFLVGCRSANDTIVVTFKHNDDILHTEKVKKGDYLSPFEIGEAPYYYQYWDVWYSDSEFNVSFDFNSQITESITLYTRLKSIYDDKRGEQYEMLENESDYWYQNNPTLARGINYAQYNLLETVKKGDILYEATGGFGITGHIAIVEGIFYSEVYNQYYIRLIEAVSNGVIQSIWTPTRFIEKETTILRLKDYDEVIVDAAIEFALGQLGKSYSLAAWKNSSESNSDWYCSELVWAAYYHQNVLLDIDDNNHLGSIVFPNEIKESNELVEITSYQSYGKDGNIVIN